MDRKLVRVETAPGMVNYFAGGHVRMRCRGQDITMTSDSVANYQDQVVQFIGQVRYRDSTVTMDADFGTYYKAGEHWDAQGNVVYRDLGQGSTLRGPRMNYYRAIKGQRPEAELFAEQRPTLLYAVEDSAGKPAEPYTIVGDRIRIRGRDRIWSGGTVTIDRTDLRGRGDSLQLDTGKGSRGVLLGRASMQSVSRDSFSLVGKRIDLALENKELRHVVGKEEAKLTSKDVTLDADSIGLDIQAREAQRITGWGKTLRPHAVSADYEMRGDSLVIDTPAGRLRQVRAFGSGWAGLKPDSATGKRDWIAGDTVTAHFVDRDSTATDRKTTIDQLEAQHSARSYYRLSNSKGPDKRPSVNYSRADRIVVTLKVWPDSTSVERIDAQGNVDGVHLEPITRRPDSTRRDTVRVDTIAVRRRVP